MAKVKVSTWVHYAATLDDQVVKDFRRTCRARGLVQAWVLSGLMRRFVENPDAESKFIQEHFGEVPEWLDESKPKKKK